MRPTIFSLSNQLLDAWDAPAGIVRLSKLERTIRHDRQRVRSMESKEPGSYFPLALDDLQVSG